MSENLRDEFRVIDCRDDLVTPRHLTVFRHPSGAFGLVSFGGNTGTVRLQITEDEARELGAWLVKASVVNKVSVTPHGGDA